MHDPGQLRPRGIFFLPWFELTLPPDFFEEPEIFRPERFLENKFGTKAGADIKDFRDNFGFGAGRVNFYNYFGEV